LPFLTRADYADHPKGISPSEQANRGSNVCVVHTPEQIAIIREVCKLGAEVLAIGAKAAKPGVTTDEIDAIVHQACVERDCYPSPLNYRNFPKSVCTSINEVICHGIPDSRKLRDGDILNVDVTVYKHGFHADLNETYLIGNVDEAGKKLVKTAYECLELAIQEVKPGVLYRDVGKAIQKHATKNGCSVVRTYCGHGIGELFHTAPNVPHYANVRFFCNLFKDIANENQKPTV
jgi:methionyl aminopeptidase